MHLIIPFLFPSADFLHAALQDMRLPALETLVARGRLRHVPAPGLEGALCQAWGIARQNDWPWAAASLLVDEGDPGEDYWLRADPVHLRIQRDRLILLGNEWLDISPDEAETLSADLRAHFGGAFQPQALQPGRWYWRLENDPRIETTPLSLAIGRHIDPLLPRGADALKWRALLNEIQMLLFSHPVNQAREAHGLPVINSIWLWGGGRSAQARPGVGKFYCTDSHLVSLARHLGVQALPWSGRPEEFEADGLVLLSQLNRTGQYGDVVGWRNAVTQLDAEWLARLAKSSSRLQIEDPMSGTVLDHAPGDRWKFWRRAKPLVSNAPVEPIGPPPSTPDVDEFGNVIGKPQGSEATVRLE